jgi:glycosyltransferase involved in cell wall biosynthesis
MGNELRLIETYRPVLHIVPTVENEASGVDVFVRNLCINLSHKIEIKLFTLIWTKWFKKEFYLEGFELARFLPKRLGSSKAMKSRVARAVRCNEFSIIHNHGLWMMPTIYSGLYKNMGVYKFILSPHGAFTSEALSYNKWSKKIFNILFQNSCLNKVDYFHATSMSEYRDIRRLGYKQPVIVIPPGVHIPKLQTVEEKDRQILIFLSRLHEGKGLEMLLKSWSNLEKDFGNWDLHIYGGGDEKYVSKLKKYMLKLGISRANFNGPVYGEAKDQVLQNASLFVLPTYSENFGIAVAESLANATPVIVSKGAPWEDLESKGAGWWIDIGSSPLTIALSVAMNLPRGDLKLMGLRGRKWMAEEYSWDALTAKFVRTYDWIVSSKVKPDWVKY